VADAAVTLRALASPSVEILDHLDAMYGAPEPPANPALAALFPGLAALVRAFPPARTDKIAAEMRAHSAKRDYALLLRSNPDAERIVMLAGGVDRLADVADKLDLPLYRAYYHPLFAKVVADAGHLSEYEENKHKQEQQHNAFTPEPCVIASACSAHGTDHLLLLRRLRDDLITEDPIARDFFHVFWSRYYEWSPPVARLANENGAIADHLRWSFLEPWMVWIECIALMGRRSPENLTSNQREMILCHLHQRIGAWLLELPARLEEKCPVDLSELWQSFDRACEKLREALFSSSVSSPRKGQMDSSTESKKDREVFQLRRPPAPS